MVVTSIHCLPAVPPLNIRGGGKEKIGGGRKVKGRPENLEGETEKLGRNRKVKGRPEKLGRNRRALD